MNIFNSGYWILQNLKEIFDKVEKSMWSKVVSQVLTTIYTKEKLKGMGIHSIELAPKIKC